MLILAHLWCWQPSLFIPAAWSVSDSRVSRDKRTTGHAEVLDLHGGLAACYISQLLVRSTRTPRKPGDNMIQTLVNLKSVLGPDHNHSRFSFTYYCVGHKVRDGARPRATSYHSRTHGSHRGFAVAPGSTPGILQHPPSNYSRNVSQRAPSVTMSTYCASLSLFSGLYGLSFPWHWHPTVCPPHQYHPRPDGSSSGSFNLGYGAANGVQRIRNPEAVSHHVSVSNALPSQKRAQWIP
jgi:hypothetical protein